jgi:hypothetical protein
LIAESLGDRLVEVFGFTVELKHLDRGPLQQGSGPGFSGTESSKACGVTAASPTEERFGDVHGRPVNTFTL